MLVPPVSKIETEKIIVEFMIRKFCRDHHQRNICAHCAELIRYAGNRLSKCPFGDGKPSCRNCRVHCYEEKRRAQIKEVMRKIGPRMIFLMPIIRLKLLLRRLKG